jgi:hypothetical protein
VSSSSSSSASSPSQGDDAISREFALKAFRSRLAFKVKQQETRAGLFGFFRFSFLLVKSSFSAGKCFNVEN